MRLWAHTGLALALLMRVSTSPFEHYHPEDPHHRHEHHTDDAHGEAEGPEVEAPDHDATACFQESVVGERAPDTQIQAEAPLALVGPVVFALEPAPPTLTPRSHDPPALANAPARAPPISTCL